MLYQCRKKHCAVCDIRLESIEGEQIIDIYLSKSIETREKIQKEHCTKVSDYYYLT